MIKTPHECWVEANGDKERYRELMIECGNIVKRESEPEPHIFDGLTSLCFCKVCGGTINAPWHSIDEYPVARQAWHDYLETLTPEKRAEAEAYIADLAKQLKEESDEL